MSNTQNPIIGYLNISTPKEMIAELVELSQADYSKPMLDNTLIGQIGTFVSVEQADIRVLGQVMNIWREDKSGSGRRRIRLLPLGEILADGNFVHGVRRYPTPGALLRAVQTTELTPLFSEYERYGYEVGALSMKKDVPVFLDPNTLFGRHFAILGQSGSGKSWTVTSLIQRAVKAMPNAHIIMLDLHGEYCWKDRTGKLHAAFDPNTVRHIDVRDLEIPFWLLSFQEMADLLIDRADPGASVQLAFLRQVLFALKKKANAHLDITRLSVDSPVYFSLKEMYLHFKKANEQQLDFGKTKGALFGQFDEFLIKLESKLNDARYDFLFKPKKRRSSESLADLIRDFVGMGDPRVQITVIDLSAIPMDVRPIIAAQIGKLAYEFNFWNPNRHDFPIALFCEEAHSYLPRETDDDQYKGTRKSMERIAKEGRKYGVGLVVISQRPTDLSETILAQCGTFLCMRLSNPDDQGYIRKLMPAGEQDLVDSLSSLGRGEMIVMGEAIPLPTRFQMHIPNPPPYSSGSDYHLAWRKGFDEKIVDIDDIADRWRRQIR